MMLITDLDNTLYDWVTFFAKSFLAMLKELSVLIDKPEAELVREFRDVHQSYGNSEQPFAILELPAVHQAFHTTSRYELLQLLNAPLHAFNSSRKKYLKLYDGVEETLRQLCEGGVIVVGHTEAIAVNAYYRLYRQLGISKYFTRLYVLEGRYGGHPDPKRQRQLEIPRDFVKDLPRSERKPNPAVLEDICRREGTAIEECWYVGDSLVRDISMARAASVKAVWARYGTKYDRELWDLLVSITHWTDEDVAHEEQLRSQCSHVQPDFTIDSFRELLTLIPLTTRVSDSATHPNDFSPI